MGRLDRPVEVKSEDQEKIKAHTQSRESIDKTTPINKENKVKQPKVNIELFKEMLYMHKIQYRKDYENIIKKCKDNNRDPNDYSIFRRYIKVIKQLEELEKK